MKNTNGTKRLYIYIMEKKDLEELRKLHNEDGTLTKLSNVDQLFIKCGSQVGELPV